jgi:hypothetical protein
MILCEYYASSVMEPARQAPTAAAVLREADSLDLDPLLATYSAAGRAWFERDCDDDDPLAREAALALLDPAADTFWQPVQAYSQLAVELGSYSEERLALFGMDHAWEVAAQLDWGVGNQTTSAEHLAMLRYFEAQFGAEIAEIDSGGCQLLLPGPVEDRMAAFELALVLSGYADTSHPYGTSSDVADLASYLTVSTAWWLWWD